MERFVIELKELLESYQEFYIKEAPVFLDKERLRGGALFNQNLSQALCQSVCMVVVYTPPYEEQDVCLQEYAAMEALEKKRLELIRPHFQDAGLIIPVILRVDDKVPSKIKGLRHFHDFSRVYLDYKKIASNKKYLQKIDEIALTVRRLHAAFQGANVNPCLDCDSFSFPPLNDSLSWRTGAGGYVPPFPGREMGR